jgi:hypothetical protein
MVGFGWRLRQEAIPGWRYLDYPGLKRRLALVCAEPQGVRRQTFQRSVDAEVASAVAFYRAAASALEDDVAAAEAAQAALASEAAAAGGARPQEGALAALARRWRAAAETCTKLLQLIDLNVTVRPVVC